MKSYFRFLSRNKVYTFINVVGLSVSFAFVIIIGLYSQMEFGRDRWHKNADRIYVTCNHYEKENETEEVGHWALQPQEQVWAGISTDPLARVRSKQRPTEGCSRCERIQRMEGKILGSPEDWPGHERGWRKEG